MKQKRLLPDAKRAEQQVLYSIKSQANGTVLSLHETSFSYVGMLVPF